MALENCEATAIYVDESTQEVRDAIIAGKSFKALPVGSQGRILVNRDNICGVIGLSQFLKDAPLVWALKQTGVFRRIRGFRWRVDSNTDKLKRF